MRRLLSSFALLCAFTISVSALAQPKSRRRGRVIVPPGRAKKVPPPKPDKTALCASRQNVLAQEQRRLDHSRAELASLDAEVAELKRRLGQMATNRANVLRSISTQDRRVQTLKATHEKECKENQNCTQYEGLAGTLGKQADEVEKQMAVVRSDISSSSSESAALRKEIDPLRAEYARLSCNNLVPGSTAQHTIDRCAAIFSQWNRLQARVNQLNNRLASLKGRYQRLLSQLQGIESRGKGYEAYLARHCSSSAQLVKVRGYGGVRQRAERLGKELDRLIDEASKLRGIQITVSPR